jgi:ubiquinone/menaquinone biosynthesis C-methylase UbiE
MIIFGKYDFNKIEDWESSYVDLNDENLNKIQNRIPNLTKAAVNVTLQKSPGSVLDVSAGFGNYILKLDNQIHREATEFSEQAIQYLNGENIKTAKAILPNLPYQDNQFDILVSISVFEHLKNRKIVHESFIECHRVCRHGFLFSVPFDCMEPWNTLVHNHAFTKEQILEFTKGLFEMESWEVIKDNKTTRCLCFLRKIN